MVESAKAQQLELFTDLPRLHVVPNHGQYKAIVGSIEALNQYDENELENVALLVYDRSYNIQAYCYGNNPTVERLVWMLSRAITKLTGDK